MNYPTSNCFYQSLITSFEKIDAFCKKINPSFVYTESAVDYLNFLLVSCDGILNPNCILTYPFEKINDNGELYPFINIEKLNKVQGKIADSKEMDCYIYKPLLNYILFLIQSKYQFLKIVDAWHIQEVIFCCEWLKKLCGIHSEINKIPIFFSNQNTVYIHEVSRDFMIGFIIVYSMIKECPSTPVIYQKDLFNSEDIKNVFMLKKGNYHDYKYTILTADDELFGFNSTDFIDGFKTGANWGVTLVKSLYKEIYRWEHNKETNTVYRVEKLSVK